MLFFVHVFITHPFGELNPLHGFVENPCSTEVFRFIYVTIHVGRVYSNNMQTKVDTQRLDKWLWAARFFKTRKLAADAVAGGKVHLNHQRTKPGKEIKTGSTLLISKDHYSWDITITGINSQRRPAKEAVLLYEESPESQAKRQQQIEKMREERALFDHTHDRRPNKKQRRQIHRFKQG